MTQATLNPTTTPRVASRLARAGFERPVEHLHFDRRARVWWSHNGLRTPARPAHTVATTAADGVSE